MKLDRHPDYSPERHNNDKGVFISLRASALERVESDHDLRECDPVAGQHHNFRHRLVRHRAGDGLQPNAW
jgi:hypothetical protein